MDSGATVIPQLIQIAVTLFAVVGGCMATLSGLAGGLSLMALRTPEALANGINLGAVAGFILGALLAMLAFLVIVL